MRIAAFDFDGTITRKDTLALFIRFAKGQTAFFVGLAVLSPILILYKLGLLSNEKAKQAVFSWFFKGMSIERFNALGQAFIPELSRVARPDALAAIARHRQAGDQLVIVSASIENWVAPYASSIGIDMVLATQAEIDVDGKLTGRFASRNCYGEEKVHRLKDAFPVLRENRSDYFVTAYGDSAGDAALLTFADKGYLNQF